MSKEVKRWDLRIVNRYAGDGTGEIETDATMKAGPHGRYVLHSDYDALLAERDALLDERDRPTRASADVLAERRRQVEREGWTPAHDDLYSAAELPRAAAAYVLNGANDEAPCAPCIWPFHAKWWKPRDARANYVRAAALLLAEIERIDRAALQGAQP
jgi:hypothetical protein